LASINVAAGKIEQLSMENFKGNLIGLTARESDVMCDRVKVTFTNGHSRAVFKGRLPKGLSVRVDLPPGTVERVTFECHPIAGSQATVDLAADSGTARQG
jgi:hypothetical protein